MTNFHTPENTTFRTRKKKRTYAENGKTGRVKSTTEKQRRKKAQL